MLITTVKKEKKYIFTLIGLVSLITLLIWIPSFVYGRPITYGTDLKPQWYQFYYEFNKLIINFIKNKQLPFYSWDMFLGNNFYASKGYYMIGDIYAYIGLIDYNFITKNFFDLARDITYLKFLVSSIGFYLFLTKLDRKSLTKIICSLAYTFSGWAIFYSGQLVFLSFYSFVPFYLLGMELYIKDNKWILFVISTSLLFSTNFYFFYILSAFSPIYFLYRYYYLGNKTKGLTIKVFKLIGYYFLGSLLSSFVWLPAVLYFLNSPRSGSASDYNLFYTYKSNLYALASMLHPDYLTIYRNNIFDTNSHVEREICMYSSAILALYMPQYFKYEEKNKKLLTIVFYLVFILCLLFTPLSSLIQGFGDPCYRWTFMIIILNLIIISKVIDDGIFDKRLLSISTIVYVLILLGAFYICSFISEQAIDDYTPNLTIFIIFAAVIIVGNAAIRANNKKIILSLVTLELGLSVFYNYYYDMKAQPDVTYSLFESATTNLATYPNELNETLNLLSEDNNKEFYRVFVPYGECYWYMSQNMSVFFGVKGVMTYDSSLNPYFISMSNSVPEIMHGCSWLIDIKDQNILDFLNVKYAVVTPEYLMDNNWNLVKDDYLDRFYIYENENYRKLGTTYSKVIYKDLDSKIDNTNKYLDHIVVNDKTIEEELNQYVSDAEGYIYNVDAKDNHLIAQYTSNKNGFMVTGIPYDTSWKLLADGLETEYYNVNGGFIGFKAEEGIHDIEMYFVPKGFKEGVILSTISLIGITLSVIINKKREVLR